MTAELQYLEAELRSQQSKLDFADCDIWAMDFYKPKIAAIKRKITKLKNLAKKGTRG